MNYNFQPQHLPHPLPPQLAQSDGPLLGFLEQHLWHPPPPQDPQSCKSEEYITLEIRIPLELLFPE